MATVKAKKTADERRRDEANEMIARAKIMGYLVLDGRGRGDVVWRRNGVCARPRWTKHRIETHRPNVVLAIGSANPKATFRGRVTAEYPHLGLIAPHHYCEIGRRLLSVEGRGTARVSFSEAVLSSGV